MSSEDDDIPLASMGKKKKLKIKVKKQVVDDDDGDVDMKPAAVKSEAKVTKKKRKREAEPEPVKSSSAKKKKTAATATSTASKKELKKLEKAERMQYAMQSFLWWNAKEPPEGCQWETMEHAGVSFPEPYQPHGIKMNYDGKPVDLTPLQEEA